MATEIKSKQELDTIRQAANIASSILCELKAMIRPGISTKDLDNRAIELFRAKRVKSAFLNYRGFPANICVSVNDELVHGIPSRRKVIKEGDIVTIDLGINYDSFYGDIAETVPVGKVPQNAISLIEITKSALYEAIRYCLPGNRVGDISYAIQSFVEQRGYSVSRDYCGHGIGRQLHEEPEIPNFGKKGTGARLLPYTVLAIEVMVMEGDWQIKVLDDKWTVTTKDGKLCAHFEHMVAITNTASEILTHY